MELKLRQQNESSILMVATKINYKDFSPQIWFFMCRITLFIWCYAYHDYQSWIMLAWIMHSTIFKSMKRFFAQTVSTYLPIFLLTFLFYYIINIPRVFEFQSMGQLKDVFRSLGFYQFQIPPLEVALMLAGLSPFFFLIKSRKYLNFNREEQKGKFLEKLTRKDSPTLFYLLFWVITNLDLLVFIAIFFSGVNKIDFYHVFLMFFFVAYITAPEWFNKNYIYLLYYVDFFVFEKYLYTLVEIYLPDNSWVQQLLDVLGLSTDYEEKSDACIYFLKHYHNLEYFRYPPKIQQWLLIVVVFLQFQVHKLLQDKDHVNRNADEVTKNFKDRYPRIAHFWELLRHAKKEFLVLLTFVVFFVIIIFSDKNIINWGFQIIICIFIITYVGTGVNKHLDSDTGIKRLQKIWFMIIWYASFVLIVQITFQFAALPFVRKSLNLDFILDLMPLWIRKNLRLIGFQVYTKYIWEKFVIYLLYFAIGIYVKEQMIEWNKIEFTAKNIELQDQPVRRNSDMMEAYSQDKTKVDWNQEFMKIRFTRPYLVYKVRKVWVIIDKCSQLVFVIISLMIMILATHWQISLSMAIHLTCFVGLCLRVATKLYQNRKKMKKSLSRKAKKGVKYQEEMTLEECRFVWNEYKKEVNEYQVNIRSNIWFFQFVITLLCIALIYPSEFIYYVRKTFDQQGEYPEIVALLDYITFYLFWAGVYHCPEQESGHGYSYNLYGYLIILVLLIFEKNAQQWAKNRFGCTKEKEAWFKEIEDNLEKKMPQKQLPNFNEQIIEEEGENEDEEDSSLMFGGKPGKKKKDQSSIFNHSRSNLIESDQFQEEMGRVDSRQSTTNMTNDEIKAELRKWISKKYMFKLLTGFKVILEETIQLLLLISSVYKDSVVGLALLFGVLLYMLRRRIKTIERLAWITGICMIIQYGLALSNLTSASNPMDFPQPYNPYPKDDQDEGQFFIPWYRKFPFLKDSFAWQIYLSMGVSTLKLQTLWIDYVIMGCIQAELFYFGCQLFSINLKIVEGEKLKQLFEQYTLQQTGRQDKQTIKKETKKLKRTVLSFSLYKSGQMSIFLHFHQITILITLLLAILARSLVSFGYILVCMVMIYENHKFYVPQQENFRLKQVLKYWVQPFVFLDITMQMVYQIPLDFLHKGQDEPNSWQNIIGLVDIWIEERGQVNEISAKSLIYIILKAFTYYFVTLQIQIFSAKAYEVYIGKDFKKLLGMTESKGKAIIWRANNFKIKKIREQQQEKTKMDDMLKNLKKVLTKWQSLLSQDLNQQMQVAFESDPPINVRDSFSQKRLRRSVRSLKDALFDDNRMGVLSQKQLDTGASLHSKVDVKLQNTQNVNTGGKQLSFLKQKTFTENNSQRSSMLPLISEVDEFYGSKPDHELLVIAISKLNIFLRFLIWVKKNLTDQIVFISSQKYLDRVVMEMEHGKLTIYSKLERRMLSDIRDMKKKKIFEELNDIDIKDMRRTKDQLRFSKIFSAYIRLMFEIIATYSDSICYILMIVSMMKNAGLISILYPLVVFGYSLMEEINPRKRIWYMLMIYTELLILIKFVFQLSFWQAFYSQQTIDKFQDKLNGIHVGLIRVSSDEFGKMLGYFLPEILILLGIMAHIQKEIMTGVLQIKEQAQETIQEAIVRFMKFNFMKKFKGFRSQGKQAIRSSVISNDSFNPSVDAYFNQNDNGVPQVVTIDDDSNPQENMFSEEVIPTQYDFSEDIKQYSPLQRRYSIQLDNIKYKELKPLEIKEPKLKAISMVGPEELKLLQKYVMDREILQIIEQEDFKSKPFKERAIHQIQTLLYKNSYFEKLFPSVKEQKPGRDLYALIATFQSLICLFMIFFYTKMDADVTNISDSLTYNQFSGQMVIALFLQISVMILDRYLYKSKTFIAVQDSAYNKRNKKRFKDAHNIHSQLFSQQDSQKRKDEKEIASQNKNTISYLKALQKYRKEVETGEIIIENDQKDEREHQDEEDQQRQWIEDNVLLENTKITFAMVSKYYLQIFLLVFVHAFVFWYFPITGNLKLQNYTYCVRKTSQNNDKIACNEFGENWALVVFYVLYCCYFWVSALQIRYGVAEMKKGNFLMNSYHIVNYVAFKGFMAIPFIFELKTFIDWTFTRTALDVFQWFNLTATHAELYIAHSLQGRMQKKPLGKPIANIMKVILGFFGQVLIILLIAGPLLLFSTFNPISQIDPVINAQIQFNILIKPQGSQAKNTINLFTNNYVTTIKTVNDQQYEIMKFAYDPKTKSFDRELIQFVKMNNFPDASWSVSQPNKEFLKQEFQNAMDNKTTSNLFFQLSYEFDRQIQTIQPAIFQSEFNLTEPRFRGVLVNFTKTFYMNCQGGQSNMTSTIYIPNVFTGVHFLNDYDVAVPADNPEWFKGAQVTYSCKEYWTVDQKLNETSPEAKLPSSKNSGFAFFAFSSKTAPSYFKYSIITFYVSIVLVIGKLLRNVLVIGGNRLFIFETPRTEPLLQLCECVYIYRMRSQLDKEEQLYFTFVDIMRSPEMIKAITGSAMKKKAE